MIGREDASVEEFGEGGKKARCMCVGKFAED